MAGTANNTNEDRIFHFMVIFDGVLLERRSSNKWLTEQGEQKPKDLLYRRKKAKNKGRGERHH